VTDGDTFMVGSRVIEIPFIPGDGIGAEIMASARAVIDGSVQKHNGGHVSLGWVELLAGEAGHRATGNWLPESTLNAIREAGIAIKGPLTTPVGGGIRSLNVTIRQVLDLYCSVRPVRYIKGVPSPVKDPHKVDIVIFRENTEDVYKGVEWSRGSEGAGKLIEFMQSSLGVQIREDSGIGIKPISEFASKRLVRAAIRYALRKNRPSVTLVHKGNIMKFTEGAFRTWGYEVAKNEFRDQVVTEEELSGGQSRGDRLLVNDRIADNMFQQVLTRPSEYSVLAAPNLNGDYLADACAAQVGGLGFAPGANIGDRVAVFEPVHGTAPKYAGKDVANPSALILSGAMMLEYLGLEAASEAIPQALEKTIGDGIFTQDVARALGSESRVGTKRFTEEIIARL